jgi:hypothetical protein
MVMNNLSIFFLFSYTDLRFSLKNNLLFKTAIFKYVLVNLKRSQKNPYTVGGNKISFAFPSQYFVPSHRESQNLATWQLGTCNDTLIPMCTLKTGL